LFTGRFPFQHGVRDNGVPLDISETTLAQLLRARGLRTGAVAASAILDAQWGLARGFEAYDGTFRLRRADSLRVEGTRRTADDVLRRTMQWIDSVSQTQFFAWVHFYDAHAPYASQSTGHEDADAYQHAITFIDLQIGRLRAFLDSRGLISRTIIIVVGDHGESLGEHGERAHGLFIYEAVTRVPLVIRAPLPVFGGRRVADPVRSVDVFPTVLDLLGVPIPPNVSGVSLVPRMMGGLRQSELETYSETMYPRHFGWSGLRALRTGRFKLVDAPRPELYDLEIDPTEQHNLYTARLSLAAALTDRLRAYEHSGAPTRAPGPDIDRQTRAQLRALGYVSGQDAGPNRQPVLDDPKDKIALYRLITGDRTRGTAATLQEQRQ
jgi:arylsulfatase A-like enzyme